MAAFLQPFHTTDQDDHMETLFCLLNKSDDLFVASDGKAVAFSSPQPTERYVGKEIYFSSGGEQFHKLDHGSSTSRPDGYMQVRLLDRHDDSTRELVRHGDIVLVDDVLYKKADNPGLIEIVPLPHIRYGFGLFCDADGTIIYLSHDKNYHEQSNARCYVGSWDQMKRVDILYWDIFLDGGTRAYSTPMGTFIRAARSIPSGCTPAPDVWRKEGGDTVVLRDLSDQMYMAIETDDGVIFPERPNGMG